LHDSGLGICTESGGVDNFNLANKMLSIIYLKMEINN